MPSLKAVLAGLALAGSAAASSYVQERALFKAASAGVVGATEHGTILPKGNFVKEEFLEPDEFTAIVGGQVKKITYGPYSVNPSTQSNGMQTYFALSFQGPCQDCSVYAVKAGLEYPDGRYANSNTSLWLHHMVVWDSSRHDTVCGPSYYGQGNRWFASGNERTGIDTSLAGGIKAGYYLPQGNAMHMLVEFMNQEAQTTQEAVMWVQYSYVNGKPAGWSDVNTYWLDISGCEGASDMPAKSQTGSFSYSMSPGYTAAVPGTMIEVGGHLHDGGDVLQITRNGKVVCNSRATYGGSPGYIDQGQPGSDSTGVGENSGASSGMGGMGGMGSMGSSSSTSSSSSNPLGFLSGMFGKRQMAKMATKHISTMWGCLAPSIGSMVNGDVWNVNAMYNYQKNPGMLDNSGKQLPIMGIAVLYSAVSVSEATMAKAIKTVKLPYGTLQGPGPM